MKIDALFISDVHLGSKGSNADYVIYGGAPNAGSTTSPTAFSSTSSLGAARGGTYGRTTTNTSGTGGVGGVVVIRY